MFGGEGEEGGVLVEDVADGGGGVDTPPEWWWSRDCLGVTPDQAGGVDTWSLDCNTHSAGVHTLGSIWHMHS